MVIKKYYLVFVLAFLLMINSVFALKTVITATTQYPEHNLTINVIDSLKEDNVLANLNNGTDDDGIATFTFETDGKKDISVYVIVRKNGKIITTKQFDDLVSGEPIDIELKEEKKNSVSAPVKNQSSQNTNVQNKSLDSANLTAEKKSENKTEEKTNLSVKEDAEKITGAVSADSSFKIPYAVYYVMSVIVLGILILYALKRAKPYFSFTSQIKESSNAVSGKNLRKSLTVKDKELAAAEKKIVEAEEEIRKIKERNARIIEAERRFQEAQKELDKLKRNI